MEKIAVITGASKGIGKAIAESLAAEGYSLALAARSEKELHQIKNDLEGKYGIKVIAWACDLSLKESVTAFSQKVLQHFSRVDVLVNNIGIFTTGTFSAESDDALEQNLNLNLKCAYHLTKSFALGFMKEQKGQIINLCSVASLGPKEEAASYTISKYALKGFNDVLREEMRDYGVKVTAIYPGSVNTSSWEGVIAPREEFIQPEDIAKLVVSLIGLSENAFVEELVIKPLNKSY